MRERLWNYVKENWKHWLVIVLISIANFVAQNSFNTTGQVSQDVKSLQAQNTQLIQIVQTQQKTIDNLMQLVKSNNKGTRECLDKLGKPKAPWQSTDCPP